jgi:hypothetical protein
MRSTDNTDYLHLPFPRLNGQPHPAFVELSEQARLLSLLPYGLGRGVGPYAAALLIDRDMHLRPEAYPMIPSAGLWFPAIRSSGESVSVQEAPRAASKTQEERVRQMARLVAKKWQREDEEA